MALGNWSSWTINHKGEPCRPPFVSPRKIRLETYKNWIYYYLPNASKPLGEIHIGNLCLADTYLVARRGPQNGIFYVAWSKFSGDEDFDGMASCGVYGYDEDGNWLGVTEESKEFLNKLMEKINWNMWNLED